MVHGRTTSPRRMPCSSTSARPGAAAAPHRGRPLPHLPLPWAPASSCPARDRGDRRPRHRRAPRSAGRTPLVVDLCTGSGAIALAVKDEVPAATRARRRAVRPSARLGGRQPRPARPRRRPAARRRDDGVRRLRRRGRRRRQQPAVHPPRCRAGRPGGARPRPGGRALRRVGRRAGGPVAVAARAAVLLRDGGVLVMEHADSQGEVASAALRATRASGRRTCRTTPTSAGAGRARATVAACGHRGVAGGARADPFDRRGHRASGEAPRLYRSVGIGNPRLTPMSPASTARPTTVAPTRSRRPRPGSARAGSWCCRPTPSTASAPTRSTPDAVHALLAAKGRGPDMPPPVLVPDGPHRRGPRDRGARLCASPGRGVLARPADRRPAGPDLAHVGPRRHRRNRGAADAGRHRSRSSCCARSARWP